MEKKKAGVKTSVKEKKTIVAKAAPKSVSAAKPVERILTAEGWKRKRLKENIAG